MVGIKVCLELMSFTIEICVMELHYEIQAEFSVSHSKSRDRIVLDFSKINNLLRCNLYRQINLVQIFSMPTFNN